jgi:stage III sporulation protein SpoIIIAA
MTNRDDDIQAYEEEFTDDLELLLSTLPPRIRAGVDGLPAGERSDLVEIVLDLGRPASARVLGGAEHGGAREVFLTDGEVQAADLAHVVGRIGAFGGDNRAGIPRTLHRISAIRNRRGDVVGLTCRVGRSVRGTVDMLRDLVEGEGGQLGRSVLILGRPGVGKTTLLREVARVLADESSRRVVVVDTSNEIAGDGDIPHPGIGRARRMQVPSPDEQHAVMIEAVENHTPQVIVIDEIGTEREAQAARTIAERGVQLVGTAHGTALENLLQNPTLADLVGGVQPVTLGDDEARRRGTQKTVLERKGPPTFDVLVEMRSRSEVAVHRDVAATVDAELRGLPMAVEMRTRRPDGTLERRLVLPNAPGVQGSLGRFSEERGRRGRDGRGSRDGREVREGEPVRWDRGRGRGGWGERAVVDIDRGDSERGQPRLELPAPGSGGSVPWPLGPAVPRSNGHAPASEPVEELDLEDEGDDEALDAAAYGAFRHRPGRALKPVKIYPFGVNRDRLETAVAVMHLPVTITKDVREADVVMTLKNYYRKSPGPVRDAEEAGKPVFILRSNTVGQIQQSLEALYGMEMADPPRDLEQLVLRETEDAINKVLQTARPVELPPQNAYIRRLQHQLAERSSVGSHSTGREPHRRVRLFRREDER